MAKYYGNIGFSVTEESEEHIGVWEPRIIEKPYPGDVNRIIRKWEPSDGSTNDNINISMEISIIADPYAIDNSHFIKYAEWKNTKWKVTSATPIEHRLILALGGVYNGEPNRVSQDVGENNW